MTKKEKEKGTEKGKKKSNYMQATCSQTNMAIPSLQDRSIHAGKQSPKSVAIRGERLTIHTFSLSILQYFLIPLFRLGNTCISFRNPRLSVCLSFLFFFLFFFGHPIILRLFCQVRSITNLTNGISHQPASQRHYSMYLPHGPDETHQLIIDDRVDELKQSRSGQRDLEYRSSSRGTTHAFPPHHYTFFEENVETETELCFKLGGGQEAMCPCSHATGSVRSHLLVLGALFPSFVSFFHLLSPFFPAKGLANIDLFWDRMGGR